MNYGCVILARKRIQISDEARRIIAVVDEIDGLDTEISELESRLDFESDEEKAADLEKERNRLQKTSNDLMSKLETSEGAVVVYDGDRTLVYRGNMVWLEYKKAQGWRELHGLNAIMAMPTPPSNPALDQEIAEIKKAFHIEE